MNRNTKWIIAITAVIALALVAIGVVRERATLKPTVGAIVFLTGPQAALGEEVRNAMTLGVEDINAKGGIKGQNLEVIYEDSKDSPRDAILAFNQLEAKKVPLIVSTGDVVSLNLAPVVNERGIPMIATVAAGPDIGKGDKWVFRVFIQATRQAQTMGEFAVRQLGIRSAAILAINNEFGQTTSQVFGKVLQSNGVKITGQETFGVADRDVRGQVTKLKAQNPDAIFVTGFGDGYGAAIKQLRELRYEGILLTDATLSIPYFQQQTTGASEGAYFTSTVFDQAATDSTAGRFAGKYRERFGAPPSFVGAFAYDTIRLAAAALDNSGGTPDGIRTALLATKDFDGAVGKISFTEGGDVRFPLVVRRIQDGKAVTVWQGE